MIVDVHVGSDGWLFLTRGSNEVLRFYTDPGFFDAASAGWVELLRERERKARERGIVYRHLVIPDKLTLYPEFYRDHLPHPEGAPSLKLPRLVAEQQDAERLAPVLLDLLEPMLSAKAPSRKLYWKTDTHWTFDGCWVAFVALCRDIGAAFDETLLDAPELTADLVLDLGSKLDPPVTETHVRKLFSKGAERAFANALVQYKEREDVHDVAGLHVGSHIVLRNTSTATDPRTVVLFGDSYSECRLRHLTGLIAETFANTHFIWNHRIDWDYVDRIKPDVVLSELGERFHTLVPADDLRIEEYADKRLNEYLTAQTRAA